MGLLLPDLNESPFLQSAIPNGIRPSPTSQPGGHVLLRSIRSIENRVHPPDRTPRIMELPELQPKYFDLPLAEDKGSQLTPFSGTFRATTC